MQQPTTDLKDTTIISAMIRATIGIVTFSSKKKKHLNKCEVRLTNLIYIPDYSTVIQDTVPACGTPHLSTSLSAERSSYIQSQRRGRDAPASEKVDDESR